MGRRVVFELRGVSKAFKENHVLKDVSFTVERGEILGLIGASGSGKTTLLNLLVGFLRPDHGVVKFTYALNDDEHIYNVLEKPLLVNKSYGFAAQHPSFYEKLTVRENLDYFGRMYNLSGTTIRDNIETLLRLMGLKTSQYVLAKDLSGGMQRRLDIACALIHNPSVLILDEPTADLDPVLRNQIWDIVKRINSRGTTVILSSHHLNELDTLCMRIAILKDGALLDIDTPEKLKTKYSKVQELLIETYPGSYEKLTQKLRGHNIASLRQKGTYLAIRTEEPQRLLKDLLILLDKEGEQLLDIRLNKPNLDDVFVQLFKKRDEDKQEAGQQARGAQ